MKTRIGKIARLPKKIRDELNRRLEDAWTGPKLVAWLNTLPAVQRVMRDQFRGQPVTEQNLCHWREGGYADWLRHQETQAQMRWMVERSDDVDEEENGDYLCERLARVATAELAQHAQTLSEIEDPKERWKQFREICHELWRLRSGTHYGRSVQLTSDRWERVVDQEDAAAAEQEQRAKPQESQEEYLERLMNLLHMPDLREWVRTDWPNKETEMARLKEIYHLRPDSKNTPRHPSQGIADAGRRMAVYNYPNSTESK
jgi:hypothetical protein